jgi:hypothetical protein
MLAVVFALTSTAQAGKLSAARSEIRSESERDDSDDDSNNSGLLSAARDEVRNDDPPRRKRRRRYYGYDYPVAPIVIYESTDADPPAVPQPLTRPDVIDPQHPAIVVEPIPQPICKYPYSGRFGGYRIDKPWAARLNLEHGFRTASVQREGFGLLLESEQRLGLQVNWNGYDERLPFGRHDHLQFGDVNVLVRVFDEPSAQVRLGVGVNWLHDRFGTDAGLNLTAAADVFPVKPIVLSGQLDVGTIGDTSTFHTRVTAGVLWKRLEFFGGYDYRTFGSVSLHGPVAGLRIWF